MAEEHKALSAVLQANVEFTKNLYTILAKKPGNVFFSPISIHALLSLIYQGARGRTQEAFAKTLNVPDARVAALGYKDVMSHLNSVTDIILLISNKVFLQDSYKLNEAFNTVAVQQFSSEVELLDFKQSEAAATSINMWVKKKTNGIFNNIISSNDLTPDTALVLVNAIYFKGKWVHPFNVQNTKTEKFYLNDVDTVHVQMMHITQIFSYKEDASLNAKVLKLLYANTNFSLIVVLPNERNGIAELEQKLAGTDINKLLENMSYPEVTLALPKFKIEQTIDLKDSLTELGLGIIFQKSANFSGICETTKGLHVAQAKQKAFIEVNEEGTEAAAVTVFRKRVIKNTIRKKETFIADKPFIIILISEKCVKDHNGSNLCNVLFYGKIASPPTVTENQIEL